MATIVDCPECQRKLRVPEELLGQNVKCPTCGAKFVASPSGPDGQAPASPIEAPAPPLAASPVATHASEATAAFPPPPGDPSPLAPAGDVPPPLSLEPQIKVTLDERVPPNRPREEPSDRPDRAGPSPPNGPADRADRDLLPCPYCGERIAKLARRCRFCGETLEGADDRPWERPRRQGGVRRDCDPHRGTLILVLGILSLVLSCIGLPLGIAAVIMGRRDLKRMDAGEVDPDGRGLTQAGWICGIVGTIMQSLTALGCGAYFGLIGFIFYQEDQQRKRRMAPPPITAPRPPPKKLQSGWPLRLPEYLPSR